MYEQNQETIQKDHGYIVLYNRNNSPNWQTRIKLKGVAKGIKKSTQTENKTAALLNAERIYHQLVDKFKTTGNTQTKTYNQVAIEWLRHLEEEDKDELIVDNFRENLHRHSLKYWTNTPIDLITDKEIIKFVSWRKKKYKGLKDSTLKRGFVPIKQVFSYAYTMGYIKEIPAFPKLSNATNPRPDFIEDEWQEITTKLENWLKISPKKSLRSRIYLKYYILIMGNSGVRTGTEAQSITWGDIVEMSFKGYQDKQTVIYINKGKTKERITVPPRIVKNLLLELKTFRVEECKSLNIPFNDDEPIFCNAKGVGTQSYKKGYRTFLKHYNLLTNKHNKTRALYSLRHTFATRMNRQNVNLRNLSQNMGTSLKMLEKTYLHDDIEDFGAEFINIKIPRPISALPI